jgi:hypothetical protein
LLSLALAGCPPTEAPGSGGDADGGWSAKDGGALRADGGRLRLSWPEPSFTLEGASDPSLVASSGGARTLVYRQGGKLWAHRDPPAGTPTVLADPVSPNGEISVSASPSADRIFVAFTDNSGVSLTAGQPDGARFWLYEGIAGLNALGAGWLDGAPVLSAYTSEVWYGSDHYPPTFLAFAVPLDTPAALPLPAPTADQPIQTGISGYHHYDEAHRFLDLGGGKALLFRTSWASDPADPNNGKAFARWYHLARKAGSHYLVSVASGLMAFPSPAAWIQAHDLGGGRYALTWGASASSLVYDVHVAGLALDADGTPSLSTPPVNVSMTTGLTQNSDLALLLPAGDGRYWIAWREADFGPMVALLDGQDFRVLALGGPSDELHCDQGSSMGAVVGPDGTLHLAAGFNDGIQRVSYFELRRP